MTDPALSTLSEIPGVEGWHYGPKRIDRRGVAHVQVFSDDNDRYFTLHVAWRLLHAAAARRIANMEKESET